MRIVFRALSATVTAPLGALLAAVLYFRLLAIKAEQPQVAPASVPQQPGDGLG